MVAVRILAHHRELAVGKDAFQISAFGLPGRVRPFELIAELLQRSTPNRSSS
jgi:hypothetical protein